MNSWTPVIQVVADGEPVDSATTNRSIRALVDRTEWLRSRLEEQDTSSGFLTHSGASLGASVAVGDWVWFDDSAESYLPALAGIEFNPDTGAPSPSRESFVVGLVIAKQGPTTGTVLLRCGAVDLIARSSIPGFASMTEDGSFQPGPHYLSGTVPGKMTRNPTGAPLVPLGWFGDGFAVVDPSRKEIFEGHLHHRYGLHSKPASTFGLSGTGWGSRSDGSNDRAFVDHALGSTPETIQLSIRRNPVQAPSTTPMTHVVEVIAGGALEIRSYLAHGGPGDVSSPAGTATVPVPAYGEWIAVGPDGSLEIAFVRIDRENSGRYGNPLATDLTEGYSWAVHVPSDFRGWTNVNDIDPCPTGARFRYVVEGHHDLFAAFPPVPDEGLALVWEGSSVPRGTLWDTMGTDLFWLGDLDAGGPGSTMPWPSDYDAATGPVPTQEASQVLSFTTNPLGPVESIVRSLRPGSGLVRIRRLGGTDAASTGQLEIDVDLGMAVDDLPASDSPTALSGIVPESGKLRTANSVARLVAGPNIRLSRILPDGSTSYSGPFVGRVRVEALMPDIQEGSASLTLFNAKQSERNGVVYAEFLPPATVDTALVARIPIPVFDPGGLGIGLTVAGMWMGEMAQSGIDAQAVFRAEYRVARPGTNLASGLAAPSRTEAWVVPFLNGYVPWGILADEYPGASKEPASAGNLNIPPGLVQPGDQVFVRISRETNSTPFQVGDHGLTSANSVGTDSYGGSVGLVAVRWRLDLS